MRRIVVSDAGPLIALARIGHLDFLAQLFSEVLIPEAVREELKLTSDRPGAREIRLVIGPGKWLKVKKVRAQKPLSPVIDEGENEAILLAVQEKALLLIDDLKGRKVALASGVRIIGTGRILLEAKQKGFVDRISPILDKLGKAGYRFSELLIKRLSKIQIV